MFLLLVFLSSGCAVLGENNRYITKFLDEGAVPESVSAKVALAPVAVPVGLTALVVDGFIINPIVSLPKAFDEACSVFDFERIPSAGIGEVVVFPMRIVTFVAIFVGMEIWYCFIPELRWSL